MSEDLIRYRIHEACKMAQNLGEDWYFELDLESNEAAIRAALTPIAANLDLTIDDVKSAFSQTKEQEDIRIERAMQFGNACRARRDDLNVYYVYNKANRKLIVLAKCSACARQFAVQTGHIHQGKNGRVMVLKESFQQNLRKDGSALGRALRDGYPGPVDQHGDNIVHRMWNKVYTPMTVVSAGNQ